MRFIIQRVKEANVTVQGQMFGSIGRGVCILVGIHRDDTWEDAQKLIRKTLSLKLWSKWTENIITIKGDVLLVSQFTLYARTNKGSKPDFNLSMKSSEAKQMFDRIVDEFKSLNLSGGKCETGAFGQEMLVNIQNDGPVTITIDS